MGFKISFFPLSLSFSCFGSLPFLPSLVSFLFFIFLSLPPLPQAPSPLSIKSGLILASGACFLSFFPSRAKQFRLCFPLLAFFFLFFLRLLFLAIQSFPFLSRSSSGFSLSSYVLLGFLSIPAFPCSSSFSSGILRSLSFPHSDDYQLLLRTWLLTSFGTSRFLPPPSSDHNYSCLVCQNFLNSRDCFKTGGFYFKENGNLSRVGGTRR